LISLVSSPHRLESPSTCQPAMEMNGVMHNTLLVDRYIASTLPPQEAKRFFDLLLRTDSSTAPITHHIDASYRHPSGIVLDYRADNRGSVVRQFQQVFAMNVVHTAPQAPVFFVRATGLVGIEASVAYNGWPRDLINVQNAAPLGGPTIAHLVLNWPGYATYRKQVEIMDTHGQPITMGRLAECVARFVARFIEHHQNAATLTQQEFAPWRVGRGRVTLENIYIVGLVQVSPGSWMPLLQLNRFIL